MKGPADVLHVAIHDDFDKGLNGQAMLVGLTWGLYSAGGEFNERIVVTLKRRGAPAGSAAPAVATAALTRAFERSYSGTHYMSMGWFNTPPKKYRAMGVFNAADELANRVMHQFVVDLHQSGVGAPARAR